MTSMAAAPAVYAHQAPRPRPLLVVQHQFHLQRHPLYLQLQPQRVRIALSSFYILFILFEPVDRVFI